MNGYIRKLLYYRRVRHQARKNLKKHRNLCFHPNPDAILLFGMDRSGLTVAFNLIASRAGLTFPDDFTSHLRGWENVLKGNYDFFDYLKKNSYAFSKAIIRFEMDSESVKFARSFFKMEKYIITIRNPIDNIKSILLRLKIPGNLESLDVNSLNFHREWMNMFTKSENYIESLIVSWKELYDQPELINSHQSIIFKYEDFLKDRESYVTSKVIELGLKPVKSIDRLINIRYQPIGNQISNLEFFGNKNLERIYSATYDIAEKFGYFN